MTTAVTQTTNIVPVQGVFGPEPTFTLVNLIGPAGSVFYPNVNPVQSGLTITSSTIDSSVIGGTTPAAGYFTSLAAATGTVLAIPSADTDIANKAYVDSIAQGLDIKASCLYGTTGNITLSGLAVQANGDWTGSLTAGDRILVKSQSSAPANGIYVASAGVWVRSADMNVWAEVPGAFTFIEEGATLMSTGWVTTAGHTGVIGITAMPWTQFSGAGTYAAGNGLQLVGNTFSVKPNGSSIDVSSSGVQISSSWAGQTAITTLGTIATGTWHGSTIGVVYGGTGAATFTAGLAYVDGTTAFATATAAQIVAQIGSTAVTNATSAGKATNLAGGTAGQLPYQTAADTTTFLAVGSNGQVLTLAAGVPSWATPTVGTVTSVATSGTVNGITLTGGPITSTGTITLGGTLDLSSPPAIGGTTANAITGTTITASVGFVGPYLRAVGSAGGSLQNASGTNQLQWGGGGGDNLSLDVSTNMNGANAQIDISPTGTGHVHIKPTGSGAIEIAPTNLGTINNMSIGASTPSTAKFTTIDFSSTLAVSGSTGSAGQVLTSNGASAPTWTTPTAYATVTDDTSTNGTRYPLFANVTTGNLTTEYVSSTKLQYNPSTGLLTSTGFAGSGASLTSIPNSALNNSSVTIGATSVALGATVSTFTGLVSVSSTTFVGALTGNADTATTATNATNIAIIDDTSTSADYYPVWVTTTTGNLPAKVSSTKLKFNPGTGVLTVTGGTGGGAF